MRTPLSDRMVKTLDEAYQRGLDETRDIAWSTPLARVRYIRHRYFPLEDSRENTKAYAYWRGLFKEAACPV